MGGSSTTDPTPTELEKAQTEMALQWYEEYADMSEEFLAKTTDNVVAGLQRGQAGDASRGRTSADAAQRNARRMESVSPANPLAQATTQAAGAIDADAAMSQAQTQEAMQATDAAIGAAGSRAQQAIGSMSQTNQFMATENALARMDSAYDAQSLARRQRGAGLAAGGLVGALYGENK